MQSDPLVIINELSKRFEKKGPPALDNLNARFFPGKIIGLVGPDGAGKSTLIRLIAGLLLPTTGTITVIGFDSVKQAENIHSNIGYMPQKFGLYEDLTVQQNLNLYADLRGLQTKDRQSTFEKLLAFTALKPFTGRLAGALSGGMKQKLGLACALIVPPKLLLLDEPSVGVDPISRRELWKMVQNLLSEGISVVWSTAYLDEAERCDDILLLNEGKLLFAGHPKELTDRVEGRTFQIRSIETRKRQVLVNALRQDAVTDGVIQGSNVRIVLKKDATLPPLSDFHAGKTAEVIPVTPRFEDAFVDILGGSPGGVSLLAEKTPIVSPNSEYTVEAKGLYKRFGTFYAASDITFAIKKGEIFGLLGPNGAGKSTTFKMMCGLLKPTAGEAYVCGLNLSHAPGEARAKLGYMAQKFSLYGNLSVKQNLEFFSGIYNLKGKIRSDMINEMIETFSLEPYLNISAELLPLGYKQRLALACSVMHRPQVLFLDEPTSGVDPITRREFWTHINGLVEKGITVMVTTHFMDEAEYCDRIALVYKSKIIQMGTPDALKEIAITADNPNPTLEDAFIELIQRFDQEKSA
ncbi:MAG: ATP-binding cassette domain-containing protein [Parachlamydiales bacterium]